MAQQGQQTSLQERTAILDLARAGSTDPQIAATLGRPLATVRKWRRIAQRHGHSALTSHRGRPPSGALGSYPPALRATIERMRRDHPGWGPSTIQIELQRLPAWADHELPSRARIAAFLHQSGFTRRYQKHRDLPPAPAGTPSTPHHEWQLDAQGASDVAGLGSVVLINVADVLSRLKIESYPHLTTSQPAIADYQLVLRRAFSRFGLPERLSFDHASAFYDNSTPSPFPTRLHLWLLALGVAVVFSRVRTPTDHALIERTHQTMTLQTLLGQTWDDQASLWNGLDSRRDFLNTLLPSRALGQPPLSAFPSARHSGRTYRPEWEADLLDLERVASYLASGQWFRRANCHGEWSIGHQRYRLGPRAANREVALRFDPQSWELVCLVEGTDQELRLKAQGLTKAALMGELAPVLSLPVHQLTLPFSREDWRRLALIQFVADTTL